MAPSMHLYIHIPFCLQKCGYCAFASVSGGEHLFDPYCRALEKELSCLPQRPVETLFIGGGTPTALPQEKLIALFDFLHHRFGFMDRAEISLEANPGTVNLSYLQALFSAGVNRLSFGVQSFDDRELAALGRIHTADSAKEAFWFAREAGFTNISIDLIYGLPGLSPVLWQQSLAQAIELQPEHLSLYQLEIEEETPFFSRLKDGKISLPAEKEIALMDKINQQCTAAAGYEQYEISNFAQKGCECHHNLRYWHNMEWYAAGAAAVSYVNGCRARRVGDPRQYIEQITNGNTAIIETECLDKEAAFRETVIMGLRMTGGVDVRELKQRFGFVMEEYYGDIIKKLVRDGFLLKKNHRFFLSGKGKNLANQVMVQLV